MVCRWLQHYKVLAHVPHADPATADAPNALIIAARGLHAMYTPRTAERELMTLAAQYLPPGASQEEMVILARQASMAQAREDLAIAFFYLFIYLFIFILE